MNVRRALMGGTYYDGSAAEAMWQAVGDHGFDYFGAAFSAMHEGRYDADVGILGVSCSFVLDFPDADSLRQFVATESQRFSRERDEAECLAAYRRIGAAAGLDYCAAALETPDTLPADMPVPKPYGEESE